MKSWIVVDRVVVCVIRRRFFDSSDVVRPTFNSCTIYNLHIYSNKRLCDEYYDNIYEKQRQRLRFERGQHQQQEPQQDGVHGGVDNYVEFAYRDRLSSYDSPSRRHLWQL